MVGYVANVDGIVFMTPPPQFQHVNHAFITKVN